MVCTSVALEASFGRVSYCGPANGATDIDGLAVETPGSGYALAQLQVLTRHGSRTPASSCEPWLPAVAQATWLCEPFEEAFAGSRFRFKRTFSDGALEGTCETGQLIPEGRAQMQALGRALRSSYRHLLFAEGECATENVYARSSDLSRTRGSAEALLSSFLDTEVCPEKKLELATMDFILDWIYPNAKICPKLALLEREAYDDPDFRSWNKSLSQNLVDDLDEVFGSGQWRFGTDMAGSHLLDCVMTTVCTDRDEVLLPRSFADAAIAQRLLDRAEQIEYRKLRHADYARSVAAPLVARMRDELASQRHKFVLWSAHDTTVMPFRVALGVDDSKWSPYASATILELWRQQNGSLFIRLIVNGGPKLVTGCDSPLCALSQFLSTTTWATSDTLCAISEDDSLHRLVFATTTSGIKWKQMPFSMKALLAASVIALCLLVSQWWSRLAYP